MTRAPTWALRELPVALRLGLSGVVVSLLLGLWASLAHLQEHHQNRDGEPGVSIDDLVGAYHGLDRPARLVVALERGHPEDLPDAERKVLREWLAGNKVSEQYDDLELGDASPAEILARRCLSCHARNAVVPPAAVAIGKSVPLDYWDDVSKLAFSRSLEATPEAILVTSLHTHASALALITLAAGLLLAGTRWPASLRGALAAASGVGLAIDLCCQLWAREHAALVWGVALGGGAWALAIGLSLVGVLTDLWLPRSTRSIP